MQKRLLEVAKRGRLDDGPWLDLEGLAEAELTSEDPAHPIENALLPRGERGGWGAGDAGEQRLRLLCRDPQRLRRIWLRFAGAGANRTQEFVLRWSRDA